MRNKLMLSMMLGLSFVCGKGGPEAIKTDCPSDMPTGNHTRPIVPRLDLNAVTSKFPTEIYSNSYSETGSETGSDETGSYTALNNLDREQTNASLVSNFEVYGDSVTFPNHTADNPELEGCGNFCDFVINWLLYPDSIEINLTETLYLLSCYKPAIETGADTIDSGKLMEQIGTKSIKSLKLADQKRIL